MDYGGSRFEFLRNPNRGTRNDGRGRDDDREDGRGSGSGGGGNSGYGAGSPTASIPGYGAGGYGYNASIFGNLTPDLFAFLAKYGVTPGGSDVSGVNSIFNMPGTTYNPMAATQRGIFG